VSLVERFRDAMAAETGDGTGGDDVHLLPDRLSRTAARLLDADGAGLSLRVGESGRSPLGASSPEAGRAERLQFTVGTGPCLLATTTGQPVFVVEQDMRRRWPAFADLLLAQTPYRGIVSLPLRSPVAGDGAMDLFFTDPGDVPRLDVFDAIAVGDLVSSALVDAAVLTTWSEAAGPDWLRSPSALGRAALWDAVGRTSLVLDVDASSALALLRGYAYAGGRTVDAVAADLLSGRLRPADVQAAAG
jgi:hypothetical protein